MATPLEIALSGKVLTFGELLLRISPDEEGEWLRENRLPFYIAGAELNAATALALWGMPVKYMTALPDNQLSKQIAGSLSAQHIDMSSVIYSETGRLGLYFLTKGKDLKNDALIYDRANSAFSGLKPGMIDWETLFDGVNWFHFSAICPAISQDIADVCLEALKAASKKDIITSIDLNYRSKLWQYGKSPAEVMPGLVQYCDVVMGNLWAIEAMLGMPVIPGIHEKGDKNVYLEEALKISETVVNNFPKCKVVANTFRFDNLGMIRYYATLYTGGQFYASSEFSTSHIINKVGSGDCFMAGLIYGFCYHKNPKDTLEFATAAAFEKLFVESDVIDKTADEILSKIT